jgi:energy-converting hydrogenase A subunit M
MANEGFSVGSITAKLGIDIKEFQTGLKNALNLAETFARNIRTTLGNIKLPAIHVPLQQAVSGIRQTLQPEISAAANVVGAINGMFGGIQTGAQKVENSISGLGSSITGVASATVNAVHSIAASGLGPQVKGIFSGWGQQAEIEKAKTGWSSWGEDMRRIFGSVTTQVADFKRYVKPIELSGWNKFRGTLDEIGNRFQGLAPLASKLGTTLNWSFSMAEKGAMRLARSVRNVFSYFAYNPMFMALGGLIGGFGIKSLIDTANKAEKLEYGFKNLAVSIGSVSTVLLGKLRQATRGTISDIDLMQQANSAVLLGAAKSEEQFVQMADAARRLGIAMGIDINYAFQSLAYGIGRQSRLWLDNIGIIVKAEEAQKKYADQLHKTVEQLTDSEKREAFFVATMSGIEVTMKKLGQDIDLTAYAWEKLWATLKNLWKDLAQTIVGSGLAKSLISILENSRKDILQFARFMADALGGIGNVLWSKIEEVFSGNKDAKTLLSEFFDFVMDFVVEQTIALARVLLSTIWEILYRGLPSVVEMTLNLIGRMARAWIKSIIKEMVYELGKGPFASVFPDTFKNLKKWSESIFENKNIDVFKNTINQYVEGMKKVSTLYNASKKWENAMGYTNAIGAAMKALGPDAQSIYRKTNFIGMIQESMQFSGASLDKFKNSFTDAIDTLAKDPQNKAAIQRVQDLLGEIADPKIKENLENLIKGGLENIANNDIFTQSNLVSAEVLRNMIANIATTLNVAFDEVLTNLAKKHDVVAKLKAEIEQAQKTSVARKKDVLWNFEIETVDSRLQNLSERLVAIKKDYDDLVTGNADPDIIKAAATQIEHLNQDLIELSRCIHAVDQSYAGAIISSEEFAQVSADLDNTLKQLKENAEVSDLPGDLKKYAKAFNELDALRKRVEANGASLYAQTKEQQDDYRYRMLNELTDKIEQNEEIINSSDVGKWDEAYAKRSSLQRILRRAQLMDYSELAKNQIEENQEQARILQEQTQELWKIFNTDEMNRVRNDITEINSELLASGTIMAEIDKGGIFDEEAIRTTSKMNQELDITAKKLGLAPDQVIGLRNEFEKLGKLKTLAKITQETNQLNQALSEREQVMVDWSGSWEGDEAQSIRLKAVRLQTTIDELKAKSSRGGYGTRDPETMKMIGDYEAQLAEQQKAWSRSVKLNLQSLDKTITKEISTAVGEGIVDGFMSGEKSSKIWANISADLFRKAMSRVIDDIGNLLGAALSKLGLGAGVASAALSAVAIGVGILTALKSKKEYQVDDFEEMVNSSEAMRGVVAGPTNIAISKVGDSLKFALGTSELLLERIARAVETMSGTTTQAASAGPGISGGGYRFTTSTAT